MLNAKGFLPRTGKFWNCNGGGNCGTCKVELISGSVTPKTDAEKKLLAKDPSSFRLACQTCVMGPVTVRNKPDAA
jgi:ferredoxin